MKRLFAALFCAVFIAVSLFCARKVINKNYLAAKKILSTDAANFYAFWESADKKLHPFINEALLDEITLIAIELTVYKSDSAEYKSAFKKLECSIEQIKDSTRIKFTSFF